jgi:uncharacterized protein
MHQEDIIIANTVAFVKKKLHGESSGHDWWHIYRVWKMSMYLEMKENANKYVVQLAALLHDIADWKLNNGDTLLGMKSVHDWLESQQVDSKTIRHVSLIIENISFKGAGVPNRMRTIEGKIVQDADRLDAMGALGIARAFAYGGFKGREMYNPDINPVKHNSFEEYKKNQSTTINHFYEKLFLLKDQMHTETAKTLAAERHLFMECFLGQFMSEWHDER